MSEQMAFALAGLGLGFIGAVFLSVGNLQQVPKELVLSTKPFWDYSVDTMRTVASQRAHALVGALMLAAACLLGMGAVVSSATTPARVSDALQAWPTFLVVVMVPAGLLATVAARIITSVVMKKAMILYKGAR